MSKSVRNPIQQAAWNLGQGAIMLGVIAFTIYHMVYIVQFVATLVGK